MELMKNIAFKELNKSEMNEVNGGGVVFFMAVAAATAAAVGYFVNKHKRG